jgi:hypothetical protein
MEQNRKIRAIFRGCCKKSRPISGMKDDAHREDVVWTHAHSYLEEIDTVPFFLVNDRMWIIP